jgi:hypothetical protein
MKTMKNKLFVFLIFCLPLFAEENKAEESKQKTYPIYCTAPEKGLRTCWINAGSEGMIKFNVPCVCEPCEVNKPKRKKRIKNLPKGKVVNL